MGVGILDLLPTGSMKLVGRGHDGPEYAGACPACGGRDRFRIWPEHRSGKSRFWCRGCNACGDSIDLYRLLNPGMSYREACTFIGVNLSPRRRKASQVSSLSDNENKILEAIVDAAIARHLSGKGVAHESC